MDQNGKKFMGNTYTDNESTTTMERRVIYTRGGLNMHVTNFSLLDQVTSVFLFLDFRFLFYSVGKKTKLLQESSVATCENRCLNR